MAREDGQHVVMTVVDSVPHSPAVTPLGGVLTLAGVCLLTAGSFLVSCSPPEGEGEPQPSPTVTVTVTAEAATG